MKIAFITTVNHNVGDDFVREGLKYLLTKSFSGVNLKFSEIHKHSPITARYGFESCRDLEKYQKHDDWLPLWITRDRILEADIVVQSGAPVYWYHGEESNCVKHNEWYKPLIKRRFLKNKKALLANFAAGSCQRYHSDGTEFLESKDVCDYIIEFYNLCTVTTVRDTLSVEILKQLGLTVPVIPCSSIFAADYYNVQKESDDYVVINYMKGGSHYTFGQKIDFEKWEENFKNFYFELKQTENVVISCHDQKELEEAKRFDPQANLFYSEEYVEYIKLYSRAKLGIMNRVHGAYVIASFGRPSIIIGNDSRARMGSEIGIRSYFVNDVSKETLFEEYHKMNNEINDYASLFAKIKAKALEDYLFEMKKLHR